MTKTDIHKQALADFERVQKAESKNREIARENIRFVRLSEQWDTATEQKRIQDGRPCLTINKMTAFVRQVVNDARQNKPTIKVKPVDGKSDPETAEVINGLIRNIEHVSNSDAAYDTAVECSVIGGIGFIRVALDYTYDDSFDLDITIKRVPDPFTVYGDPDSREIDSSDWNTAFVEEWVSKNEFERKYKGKEAVDWDNTSTHDGWSSDDRVRVCEYWTREKVEKTIYQLQDGTVIDAGIYTQFQATFEAQGLTPIKERKVRSHRVMQHIMSGSEVLASNEFPGCYIPIIPVYGDDFTVDGERILRGLTHDAKDAQRMYNYWRTTSTELVALAPRAPWLVRQGSLIDQSKWETANTENHAYLEYRGDLPPQRQMFDPAPAGALQEAMSANDDIKAVIGIYDASLGNRSNETSGVAIMARQRQGDTGTFHFLDNLTRAIRHLGRVVVGLIPHIYDQPRIIRVLGEDGKENAIPVNQPQQPGAQHPETHGGIYDLTIGKYDVVVSAGGSYTTRREEASMQMTEMLRSFPDAAPIIAPMLAKNLDWAGADEIAEKFEAIEQAKNAPPPPMQPPPPDPIRQAELQLKQQELQIKAYDAETKRLQATSAAMSPEQVQVLIMQTLQQLMQSPDILPMPQQPMQQPQQGLQQ